MVDARTEIEIETAPNPTFTVIWLHGLGADGNDFAPIVPELGLSKLAAVRFIFPHADHMPVTINGGYRMPAWYDILSLDGSNRQIDEAGILATRNRIRALITRENARGIPSERIVLAGFSQGGAMAYTIGLTHPEKLAGIMPLSAYLPAPELLKNEFATVNRDTPLFAGHGTHDDVVLLPMGTDARDQVQALGCKVEWHTYPMAHSVCIEEIRDIGQWLTGLIK
ncbi:MAG: alpha/beta hydrolase [Candidatus Saccharibacteria bacterium]|nr:alpha/beta hydrolase [Moraxellaceae bacterium]